MTRSINRSKSAWEWRREIIGFRRDEEVTAERLREVLDYNPETGVFTWRVKPSQNVRVGDATGCPQAGGYLGIVIGCRLYRAHRLAWLYVHGSWPKTDLDHVNGVPSDNRIANLREATKSQNKMNSRMRVDNVSTFKGVRLTTFKSGTRKWQVRIGVNGKRRHLGYFDSAERAYIAYMMAAWKHFGEFANVDCPLFAQYRSLKERKAREHNILWNLARPDYLRAT